MEEDYINKEIVLLQYNGKDRIFNISKGVILKKDKFKEKYYFVPEHICLLHNAETNEGAQGSPIILREKLNYIVGIHRGYKKSYYTNKKIFNVGLYIKDIFMKMKEKNNLKTI